MPNSICNDCVTLLYKRVVYILKKSVQRWQTGPDELAHILETCYRVCRIALIICGAGDVTRLCVYR